MSELIRKLLVVVMMAVLSTGAFAQGKGRDKRPPKEPVKIKDGKGNRPPDPPPQKPKDDRGKKRP